MIGTRLEQYEITAHLGSGGMGQVYQATDSRLGRSVAIKVLPDVFARDADRSARFEREARVLASLNHPNVASIYGLERSGERVFLVMELVPGETLADWIARRRAGPDRSVMQALSIARQIAEALDSAHQNGIVHRDLKPANIKITPEGVVKVLDFGLAKATELPDASVNVSQSPTISNSALTGAGIILGTAAYMSPEQAKGHAVDKRSDIWAFGCVLFEMLTGARLFEASDVSETLAAVLMRDPDWSRLPAGTPRPVVRLLRQCLERDRSKRMRDIGGAIFALDEALHEDAPASTGIPRRSRVAVAGWVVAVLAILVASVAVVSALRRAPVELSTMHVQVTAPPGGVVEFALSPDGRSMIFQSLAENRLFLRHFDSGVDEPLAGTEGGFYAFWSPDGLSAAFFANGLLKRIDLDTAYVRTISKVMGDPRRGAWNRMGTILFSVAKGPLLKVSAEGGGVAEPATTLLKGQSSHRFPQFLPDGRRFLVLALGESQVKGVYLGSLDNNALTRLIDGEMPFSFLSPNFLLLARQGAIWAQELNLDTGTLKGELAPVAPRVWIDAQLTGFAYLSASAVGSIAFRTTPDTRQLAWLDREGRETGVLGEPDDAQGMITGFSSDGQWVAIRRTVDGNTDVWLMDTARGGRRRTTFAPEIDGGAGLSRDGSRIFYSAEPKGLLWDIYEKRVDGPTGSETPLVETPENDYFSDLSPDERHLLYETEGSNDVWALPLFGERKAFPMMQTPFYEMNPKFSPDGRWVAFLSNESGRREIWAQPFPGPGPKIQLTVGEGIDAFQWPSRAWELFYVAPGGKLMSVTLRHSDTSLQADAPRPLFKIPDVSLFVVAPDAQRFLFNKVVSLPPPISMILNWKRPQR